MSFLSSAHELDAQAPALYGAPANNVLGGIPQHLALLPDSEAFLQQVHVPAEARLSFEVQGIPFQASLTTKEDGNNQCVLWAELGYLPYSVTNSINRKHLITILEGTRALPHVQIGVDRQMKILVKGVYDVQSPPLPVFLFIPLTQFLQESLPMIRLIGEFL